MAPSGRQRESVRESDCDRGAVRSVGRCLPHRELAMQGCRQADRQATRQAGKQVGREASEAEGRRGVGGRGSCQPDPLLCRLGLHRSL